MTTHTYLFRPLIALLLCLLVSTGSHAQNEDIKLLRQINLGRDKSLDPAMKLLTNTTYPAIVAVPALELITGYARHDKEMIRNGWFTVFGLGVTGILAYGIKYGVNRPPPYVTYPDIQEYEHTISPSFPSGHSTFAFYSATTISIYYPKWYVIAPSFIWASAVSYSRLHLGDHYPTDVLAGAVLGTGTAWVSYKATKWLHHKQVVKRAAHHMSPDTPRGAG
jgi:membrane-associated phospholipid phosphatase